MAITLNLNCSLDLFRFSLNVNRFSVTESDSMILAPLIFRYTIEIITVTMMKYLPNFDQNTARSMETIKIVFNQPDVSIRYAS